jgi:CTP-dependent riboflavin kinase
MDRKIKKNKKNKYISRKEMKGKIILVTEKEID